MATLEKITVYDFRINPNPGFIYPMCQHCFYVTDCQECQAVTLRCLSVYEIYRVEEWIYDDVIGKPDVNEDDDSIINDIDSILEGVESVEKKIDQKRNRKTVRNRQRKNKKEIHDRGKRARKREREKNVASNGKEKA